MDLLGCANFVGEPRPPDEPSWGAMTSNVNDRLDRLLSEVDSIGSVTRRGDKNAAFLAWRKRAEAAVTDKSETTR